jgi:Putative transposase
LKKCRRTDIISAFENGPCECGIRIESVDETSVTYRYTPPKTRESKTRKVSGEAFVHGFSQHILTPRLQKIRYYGWMSSNSRYDRDAIRWSVYTVLGWAYTLLFASKKLTLKRTRPRCNVCGGELKLMLLTNSAGEILYSRAPAYIDTG